MKLIYFCTSLCFIYVMMFYKSLYKIHYIDWLMGFSTFLLFLYITLYSKKIEKSIYYTIILSLLWLPIAFLTPLTLNFIGNHYKGLILYFSLLIISIGFIFFIFSKENKVGLIFLITLFLWEVFSSIFLFLYLSGEITYEGGNYFSAMYINRNEYAIQTVILAGLVYYFSKRSILKEVLLFISIILVIATQSLTGVLMLLIIFFSNKFIESNISTKINIIVIFAFIILIIYNTFESFNVKLSQIYNIFINPEDLMVGYSIYYRYWLITHGFNLWLDNFWFGIGIDNSKFYLIPDTKEFIGATTGFYSHNNYIEMALNFGFFGLIIHYIPLLYFFINSKYNRYKNFIRASITMYLVSSISAVTYNIFGYVFLYVLIIFSYFRGKL